MSKRQYIDFFGRHQNKIESLSVAGLNDARKQAFADFQHLGFPVYPSEDVQQTNIAAAFDDDYGMNINRLPLSLNPHKLFQCEVPGLSTHLCYMVNDSFYRETAPQNALPDGVFSGSLNEFATRFPDIFCKYYARLAKTSANGIVAFNTMFVQDGYVLYIPKGAVVEQPIQLINTLVGGSDTLCNRRLLIIAEENAQGKLLICDHAAVTKQKFLITQVVEVFVEDHAILDIYELEESSLKTTRTSSMFIQQGAYSNVVVNGTSLYNGLSRNDYRIMLNGEHAETHLSGIAISDGQQHIDNFVTIEHNVPNCLSHQLFKYVLDGASSGVFTGRITVAPNAQKTNAYQTNRNLCVTPNARMYSKPQLEIYADDVKCSHGMTTGQLDDNALFYLRSRGISEKEARLLLMSAFTSDVLDNIRIEALKVRLRELIEKRFKGEPAKCGGRCSNCE